MYTVLYILELLLSSTHERNFATCISIWAKCLPDFEIAPPPFFLSSPTLAPPEFLLVNPCYLVHPEYHDG